MASKPDFSYENDASKKFNIICGIDEAGRGPIAGPVVAAAVTFKEQFFIKDLNDSKKISEKKRNKIFDIITNDDRVDYGIGIVENQEIDEINILNAAFKAMEIAANKLATNPDFLLIDGNRFISKNYKFKTIVKGDSKSTSIAAASIIAKVHRDNIMLEYDKKYPEYKFKSNKGYGTSAHFKAIDQFGKTPIHRNSFLIKYGLKQGKLF